MPPPKPSTEGPRDRHVFHEMGQIVRALETEGAQSQEQLEMTLGARFWEQGRFQRALAFTIADGLVVRTADGTLVAS